MFLLTSHFSMFLLALDLNKLSKTVNVMTFSERNVSKVFIFTLYNVCKPFHYNVPFIKGIKSTVF